MKENVKNPSSGCNGLIKELDYTELDEDPLEKEKAERLIRLRKYANNKY